jgi:hypothetical protein
VPLNVAGRLLSNGALAVGGGLILGLVTTFLPWHMTTIPASFLLESGSHDALGHWSGWLFLLAVLAGIALFSVRTFAPPRSVPAWPFTDAMIYVVVGAVMLLSALLWLVTGGGYGSADAHYSNIPGSSTGPSFGLFIGVIAAAAVAVGGYLMKAEPQPATRALGTYLPSTASSPPPPPPAPST